MNLLSHSSITKQTQLLSNLSRCQVPPPAFFPPVVEVAVHGCQQALLHTHRQDDLLLLLSCSPRWCIEQAHGPVLVLLQGPLHLLRGDAWTSLSATSLLPGWDDLLQLHLVHLLLGHGESKVQDGFVPVDPLHLQVALPHPGQGGDNGSTLLCLQTWVKWFHICGEEFKISDFLVAVEVLIDGGQSVLDH